MPSAARWWLLEALFERCLGKSRQRQNHNTCPPYSPRYGTRSDSQLWSCSSRNFLQNTGIRIARCTEGFFGSSWFNMWASTASAAFCIAPTQMRRNKRGRKKNTLTFNDAPSWEFIQKRLQISSLILFNHFLTFCFVLFSNHCSSYTAFPSNMAAWHFRSSLVCYLVAPVPVIYRALM